VKVACGSANKAQHEAGLRGFGYAFGEVIGTKDVLKMIDWQRREEWTTREELCMLNSSMGLEDSQH